MAWLEKLDGVIASATWLATLDGVTAEAVWLAKLGGVKATVACLAKLEAFCERDWRNQRCAGSVHQGP